MFWETLHILEMFWETLHMLFTEQEITVVANFFLFFLEANDETIRQQEISYGNKND